MARRAGVTAEETREQLLEGAARVFAEKGYDGASIAELAKAAGVSGGAIYAHFGSKAELFVATLHARGPAEVDRLFGGDVPDPAAVFHGPGLALVRGKSRKSSLLVEAIVAAQRHPEVSALLISEFARGEERIVELIRAGQDQGTVDERVRAAAVARFLTMLSLGSLMVSAADLPPVDEDDWAVLIDDMLSRFRGRSKKAAGTRTKAPDPPTARAGR
jgi:AcrR family transcriptional regulator